MLPPRPCLPRRRPPAAADAASASWRRGHELTPTLKLLPLGSLPLLTLTLPCHSPWTRMATPRVCCPVLPMILVMPFFLLVVPRPASTLVANMVFKFLLCSRLSLLSFLMLCKLIDGMMLLLRHFRPRRVMPGARRLGLLVFALPTFLVVPPS